MKFFRKICLGAIFAAIFVLSPARADAASLFVSTATGPFSVGSVFPVEIYVSTAGEAMNAASGLINFSKDKLEVMSVSKNGSIFSLWAQEPAFSNAAGTVNFEGVVLNPGYTGTNGKLLTINFRVKAKGSASVNFTSGSVLANDGQGTEILKNMGNAQFNFGVDEPVQTEEEPAPKDSTPAAPQISSPTHPDQTKWYAKKDAKFIWSLPSDVDSVRVSMGKTSKASPTVVYDPAISQRTIADVDDGIWYMHVQLHNSSGWGAISHFKFQIDTEKPSSFDITPVAPDDAANPKPRFIFDATDKLSGIDHYEVQIDEAATPEIWKDDGSHTYQTPALGPGKHTLIVKAVDKAGNERSAVSEATTEGIEAPTIKDYTKDVQSGQPVVIHGSTYPSSDVSVWIGGEKEEGKKFKIKSDEAGDFTFIDTEKLSEGTYTAWAVVTDSRGAQSLPSEKVTIVISKYAGFTVNNLTVAFFALLILAIIVLMLLVFWLWHGWRKLAAMRRRGHKGTREAEYALQKSFNLMRDDISLHVSMLEKAQAKRSLTKEEEKIMKELKRDLDDTEKFMKRQLDIIESEIE